MSLSIEANEWVKKTPVKKFHNPGDLIDAWEVCKILNCAHGSVGYFMNNRSLPRPVAEAKKSGVGRAKSLWNRNDVVAWEKANPERKRIRPHHKNRSKLVEEIPEVVGKEPIVTTTNYTIACGEYVLDVPDAGELSLYLEGSIEIKRDSLRTVIELLQEAERVIAAHGERG